jgi:hypothetical protein
LLPIEHFNVASLQSTSLMQSPSTSFVAHRFRTLHTSGGMQASLLAHVSLSRPRTIEVVESIVFPVVGGGSHFESPPQTVSAQHDKMLSLHLSPNW